MSRSRVTRVVLAALLVLLMLLLCGVSYFLVTLIRPVGTESAEESGDGGGLVWVRSIYGWGEAAEQQLRQPTDVAVGPDGTIWVTDPQRSQVLGFAPDGSYRSVLNQGPAASSDNAFTSPQALAVGRQGQVYIADYIAEKIRVLSPDNEVIRVWDAPAPMEIDVQGETVVVGTTFNGVSILTPEGAITKVLGPRGRDAGEFDGPRGIVIAEDGTIYIAEMHTKRLSAFTGDGVLKWTSVLPAASSPGPSSEGSSTVQTPAGMTMDGAGRLVLVDPFDYTIDVVDAATGKVTAKYGGYGRADGQFMNPTGIDYDPARDWFVIADTDNSRVQVVRIPGSSDGAGAVAGARRALSSPLVVCFVPFILLVLALIILVSLRRSRSRSTESAPISVVDEGDER